MVAVMCDIKAPLYRRNSDINSMFGNAAAAAFPKNFNFFFIKI